MKKRGHMAFLILGLTLIFSPAPFAQEGVESEAVEVVEDWLYLVDSGLYEESWESAAEYFRDLISMGKWSQTLESLRRPFGEIRSRELKGAKYTTTLPGAPKGEYVVVQYETTFENGASVTETVTPMKDPDGSWRVAGYYIRKCVQVKP